MHTTIENNSTEVTVRTLSLDYDLKSVTDLEEYRPASIEKFIEVIPRKSLRPEGLKVETEGGEVLGRGSKPSPPPARG